MFWKILIGVVLGVLILSVAMPRIGAARWNAYTRSLREQLEAGRQAVAPLTYDEAELAGLPLPVQRYFRTALKPGQKMIAAVSLEHIGTFNLGSDREQWTDFRSTQRVITSPPGFDWEASMAMAPGLVVRVHDAFVGGEGLLNARLFGLLPVMQVQGGRSAAEGELMRWFAEAAWYPTALLPGQGVRWEPVDDHSAKATLQAGDLALTMTFRFGEDGLIRSVYAEARGRTVGKQSIPTPWEGRWSSYTEQGGMLIPLEGEVVWLLPGGELPYWRGKIVKILYEFAN